MPTLDEINSLRTAIALESYRKLQKALKQIREKFPTLVNVKLNRKKEVLINQGLWIVNQFQHNQKVSYG